MEIVVDASIFIAVLINEPTKKWIVSKTHSADVLAPHSLRFEIANALSKLVRRDLLAPELAQTAWSMSLGMPVQLKQIDIGAALRIASSLKIYAYDGFMLQCAREASAPLLTLDKRLRKEALGLGIVVLE